MPGLRPGPFLLSYWLTSEAEPTFTVSLGHFSVTSIITLIFSSTAVHAQLSIYIKTQVKEGDLLARDLSTVFHVEKDGGQLDFSW